MSFLPMSILFFVLALQVLASDNSTSQYMSRDSLTTPINATVTDHKGRDITSSFQIMLYSEPDKPNPASNLTDRRRQPATLSRPIIDCPLPNSVFIDSVCSYKDGKDAGMQGWEMSCYVMRDYWDPSLRRYYPVYPVLFRRNGYCEPDEICVDGLGRGGFSRHGEHSVASCVKTQYFTRMISNGRRPADERQQLTDLNGKMARMVVSKADGSTPMEVDTFGVEAVDKGGKTVQREKCRDCMDLKTDTFGPETDGLKAQVRLLTTGAVAGILWLTVLSG